ncbi:ATP-binding protein [Collinsella sp. An2]|uniref:ATP-binding protein n=1 Tax=Collinsella sp. An2 TaxID=1965585 RepID=UPI000B38E968|nr:ATP-binding protein [Collinsella sp. An2]OUP07701.1 biotin carboxylase [Collinsella sp. An2]
MTQNASAAPRVPKRVAAVIINSLKGGVVPRIGLPYITVGRETEIRALLTDLDLIADGGASFRFLVGRYGSGKSFLLQTIRTHAMGEGFVVADADLSPERRLQGGQGQGLATYRELIRNLSTKTRPEGGALTLILDRWISNLQTQVASELAANDPGGVAPVPDDPALVTAVDARIRTEVASLEEMVHGFDFARLLTLYFHASTTGDDETKSHVVKWFRGEYRTKTEARQELGVTVIVGDDDWYDYIKLFARFLKGAGYRGMLVLIDELVNLYKIPNAITRQYNYEKILTMYNDTLQGKAHYLGVIMGGTPQSIEDRRRGVFSYEALRSRLTQGRFAREDMRDMLAPIIHLHPLTYEELLVLAEKLQQIHAGYFGYEPRLGENDLVRFLQIEFGRVGADTHLTPREVIRDFIELLDIVYQHPELSVEQVMGSAGTASVTGAVAAGAAEGASTRAGAPYAPGALPTREGANGPDGGATSAGGAGSMASVVAPAVPSTDPNAFAEFEI